MAAPERPVNQRALRDALAHEDVFDLIQAARAYAEVLDVVDSHDPSPEKRAMASNLRRLARELRATNNGRNID